MSIVSSGKAVKNLPYKRLQRARELTLRDKSVKFDNNIIIASII